MRRILIPLLVLNLAFLVMLVLVRDAYGWSTMFAIAFLVAAFNWYVFFRLRKRRKP